MMVFMTANTACACPSHAHPASIAPLPQLCDLLQDDMKAVNATIVTQMQSDVPLIPELANYLIAAGGKRIRPLLTLAATRLFDQKTTRCHGLATAVEFIHSATLLHDDVVDASDERRGQPTAAVVFGNQASVLVGDFLFSRAFQLMVADGSLDVLRILSNAAAVISEGEVMQLSIQNQLDATLDQYLQVIGAKTAALFTAAAEIGPMIAGQPAHAAALRAYGQALGMVFQITDDVLDYTGDGSRMGKNTGNDFREGKLTAPVFIALRHAGATERGFWQRCLADRQQEAGDFAAAIELCHNHDAFSKSLHLAADYAHSASAALAALPASALRDALMALPASILERHT